MGNWNVCIWAHQYFLENPKLFRLDLAIMEIQRYPRTIPRLMRSMSMKLEFRTINEGTTLFESKPNVIAIGQILSETNLIATLCKSYTKIHKGTILNISDL